MGEEKGRGGGGRVVAAVENGGVVAVAEGDE